MLGYHIEHPWILILAAVVLPLYLFLAIRARKRSLIPYPPIQYQPASFLPKLVFIVNTMLMTLLIALAFLSLANPYRATEAVTIEEKGIDVALVVDVSASMQATDFTPNRLEATKKILKDFVRRSGGHRIGIIVFAKHVFTLSPFTTDHLVLKGLIEGLSFKTIDHYLSGGTAIGDAILKGTDVLNQIKIAGRDQVIILMTDGDNNAGIATGLATKFAIDNNIRIYTIGLGATEDIMVKPDPVAQPNWTFTTKLVEAPLKEIAAQTGGMYFHAGDNTALNEIFHEIARLEQSPLEIDRIYQKKYLRSPLNVSISSLFIITLIVQVFFLRRPLK